MVLYVVRHCGSQLAQNTGRNTLLLAVTLFRTVGHIKLEPTKCSSTHWEPGRSAEACWERPFNLLILDTSIEKWADITYCISYMNSRSEYRIRHLLYNNILVLLKFVTEKFSTLVSFLTFVNKQFRIMSLLKYRMHHCLIILKRIIEGNTDITTVTFAWAYALKITYNLQGWHFLLVTISVGGFIKIYLTGYKINGDVGDLKLATIFGARR